jgi:energy-coupling factor transport system permease protein
MAVGLLLLIIAKVFRNSLPVYGFVLFVLFTVIIIQGLFYVDNETILFQLGSLDFYKEGLLYAFTLSMRVINIVASFLILVLTTKPSDLVESLVRKGLSPRFGYVLLSVFQIVPQMMSTVGTITDAQRSRGMETEGKLSVRIKAFLPLIGPVVLSSLIQTKERAMALEVRGFNAKGKKTHLHNEKDYAYSRTIQLGLWGIIVLAIVGRFMI